MKRWAILAVAGWLAVAPAAWASFSSRRLVLRQGDVPAIDGTNIAGAAVYTGAVDTYVDEDFPDSGFGDAAVLSFSRYTNRSAPNHRGLASVRRFRGLPSREREHRALPAVPDQCG